MKLSDHAISAADSICNYCGTRFPTETPPCSLVDRPWFAEKVQIAIDCAIAELQRENERLKSAVGVSLTSIKTLDDEIVRLKRGDFTQGEDGMMKWTQSVDVVRGKKILRQMIGPKIALPIPPFPGLCVGALVVRRVFVCQTLDPTDNGVEYEPIDDAHGIILENCGWESH